MPDLRAIAEAATPGPWGQFWDDYERGTTCLIQTDSSGLIREDAPVVASDVLTADAAHIAAWSPDRALAALDIRAALVAVLSDHRHMEYGRTGEFTPCPCGVCVVARAALARWEALNAC